MARTIGLIQTQGIGDIVIALPIATRFTDQGDRVVWPVNSGYLGFLSEAAPWIEFVGVPAALGGTDPASYYYLEPRRILEERGCDVIHSLYSKLAIPGLEVVDEGLAKSLKFDEYKYAVTGTPFGEKWNLRIRRNMTREAALYESLGLTGDYICVHSQALAHRIEFQLHEQWRRDYRIVEIEELTDSPFDWLYTLEGAAKLVLIDSFFSNLVEELGMPNEKYFLLRSTVAFTPVMRNPWQFMVV